MVNTGINLLTTIGDLTSTELKSKDNIIHKLINKSNCEENTNRISMNQSSTKITSNNTQDINVSDKNNDVNAIKEQVATIKENSRSVESNNQRSKKSKNQLSKAKPEKKVSYRNHRRLYVERYSRERYEQG